MKISELPNTPDYPLRDLAELRAKESNPNQTIARLSSNFNWHKTPEGVSFWGTVDEGQHPLIPAASIEDLRRAGMMPEPEKVIQSFERVDTAPPPFLCKIRHYGTPCEKQCAECAVDERAAKRKPSITLEDYARMEREDEINELIQTMLTPEELRGYYMGNIIKYRMRAGKKAFTGEDQSDDLFNARNFEGLLAELERGEG
jgi:hypothetical protein